METKNYAQLSNETLEHHKRLQQMQDKNLKDFQNLSYEDKASKICQHIDNVLEYEDCQDQFTQEDTEALAMKLATRCTEYTDEEKEVMDLFYSYHEEGINDADVEVQYIYAMTAGHELWTNYWRIME